MKKVIAATILAVAAAFSVPAAYQYEIDDSGNIRQSISLKLHLADYTVLRNDGRTGLSVRTADGTAFFSSGDFMTPENIAMYPDSGKTLFDQFALTEKDDSLTYLRLAGSRDSETIDIRFSDDIFDSCTKPVGEPLPGVLGALLLGGGVLGALSLKRRKKSELPDGDHL